MSAGRIESVRIRGFRSLADVELSNLQNANVLIGANGSGKSNFIRFFEMMSWMLRSRRLGEFVERYGGADDQLYGGNSVTPRMEGELALRTDKGRNDYRFALSYAHPDRFIFGCGSSSSTVFPPVHRHFRPRTVPFLFIFAGTELRTAPTRLFRAASPI